jgi:hypothetical protein
MHIFGRAKNAKIQKYGEAVRLPLRETGFYDNFEALDNEDIEAIKAEMNKLSALEKYRNLILNL